MKAYSKDLRLKALAALDRGMSRREVAKTFGLSISTLKRYLKLRRETGGVEARPIPGPPARKREILEEVLPAQVSRNPDLTLLEHCELLEDEHDVEVSTATVSRALRRLGLPLKKRRWAPQSATSGRDLPSENVRRRWPRRDLCG